MRGRLVRSGIADPLLQLPSMHAILDVVEDMLKEGCNKKEEWERLERQLYRPDPLRPGEAPPGFSDEELEASFAEFEAAFGSSGLPEAARRPSPPPSA